MTALGGSLNLDRRLEHRPVLAVIPVDADEGGRRVTTGVEWPGSSLAFTADLGPCRHEWGALGEAGALASAPGTRHPCERRECCRVVGPSPVGEIAAEVPGVAICHEGPRHRPVLRHERNPLVALPGDGLAEGRALHRVRRRGVPIVGSDSAERGVGDRRGDLNDLSRGERIDDVLRDAGGCGSLGK